MVQSLESRIHKLLSEHGDSLKVADILLKDWDSGSLSWFEQNIAGHFLVNCGFVRAFLDQVSKNLKSGQKIPWSSFLAAMAVSKAKLSKDDFDQIFIGAGEEQSLSDLVKNSYFDKQDSRFSKIRNSVESTILRAEKSTPTETPQDDPKTNAIQNTLPKPTPKEEFIAEKTSSLVLRFESQSESEANLKSEAKNIFLAALPGKPSDTQEAAIALAMMGAWNEALEILDLAEFSLQRELLKLEFLIQAHRELEVLEVSEQLLGRVLNLNQKSHVQFAQAQALVKLRRPSEAYGILEGILDENPDHMGAQVLISQLRASKR